MEPVSIVMMANASFAIARSLVHTIKELYEIAEAYETAALGIRTVATQCDSFRIAVQRINKWLEKQNEDSKYDLDEDFWRALQGNLETARLVLEDLEKRMQGLRKNSAKFWIRTKYLWNGVVIAELQSQIQGLMAAVSILLQVIDIPTTAGKRSQSIAQKQRLNGLTVRNRNRATEQHRRIQEVQAQNLHDDPEPEQLDQYGSTQAVATTEQTQGEDARPQHIASGTTAPPPYEQYSNDSKMPTTTDSAGGVFADPKEPVSEAGSKPSSMNMLEKTKSTESGKSSTDRKPKRPIWRTFMKRSGKREQPKDESDPGENAKTNDTSSSATPPVSHESNFSGEQESYSELQRTMSGVQISGGNTESSKFGHDVNGDFESPKSSIAALGLDESSTTISSPEEYTSKNPYKQLRLEAQSKPSYLDQRSDSLDSLSRTRTSQVDQGAHQGSLSRDTAATSPPPRSEPLSRQSTGGNRLGSINSGLASELQQTWQTTTLSHRTMEFKVNFESQSFTNKISSPAARALGIDSTTQGFEGVPITYLTLLYTVTEGLATDIVLGDEAEFVVMHEHESRTPLLVLGAAFAHLARIAGEGQHVYWSPGAVPENVRDVQRLRSFRRFELVSW